MGEYSWIAELGATAAVIIFCYILIRSLLKRSERDSKALTEVAITLKEIEGNMVARDQIILNHLEHFAKNQQMITGVLHKLCKEWEINNGL
jgi:hypothetical protein